MNRIHIKTIQEVYKLYHLGSPKHPLITVLKERPSHESVKLDEIEFSSDLYYITLKKGRSDNMSYGRTTYDYDDGTMIFIRPGQNAVFSNDSNVPQSQGWTLLFHPDLIRKSSLGKEIRNYEFFNYSKNEALHLSLEESEFINVLIEKVSQEIDLNFDRHSQGIIVQHLEMFFRYCNRYYERQFLTRTNLHSDFVTNFETYLSQYFKSEQLESNGLPTVEGCGNELGISGAYLSNMLKLETGRSAKEHIYEYFMEHAKTELANSDKTISEIAYSFGFGYPQHFSKLFKLKAGMSPSEYRALN